MLSELFRPFEKLYAMIFDRKAYNTFIKLMNENCKVTLFGSISDWVCYEMHNKKIVDGWVIIYDGYLHSLWEKGDCVMSDYRFISKDIYNKYKGNIVN